MYFLHGKKKILLIGVVSVVVMSIVGLFGSSAFAQTSVRLQAPLPTSGTDATVARGLCGFIELWYNFFLGVVGILAVFMVVIGGVQWLFAAGNNSKISAAKETISAAVIGMALAFVSVGLLRIINPDLLYCKDPTVTAPQVAQPVDATTNIQGQQAPVSGQIVGNLIQGVFQVDHVRVNPYCYIKAADKIEYANTGVTDFTNSTDKYYEIEYTYAFSSCDPAKGDTRGFFLSVEIDNQGVGSDPEFVISKTGNTSPSGALSYAAYMYPNRAGAKPGTPLFGEIIYRLEDLQRMSNGKFYLLASIDTTNPVFLTKP